MTEYTFCEPVMATVRSREHIREVIDGELFIGGGIPNVALCGFDITRGWDVPTQVTRERVRRGMYAEVNPTCWDCADIWAASADQGATDD